MLPPPALIATALAHPLLFWAEWFWIAVLIISAAALAVRSWKAARPRKPTIVLKIEASKPNRQSAAAAVEAWWYNSRPKDSDHFGRR